MHSYGQYILIPWGYEVSFPSDYSDMEALAVKAASKFRRYKYTVGNSADLLYPAAGINCTNNKVLELKLTRSLCRDLKAARMTGPSRLALNTVILSN